MNHSRERSLKLRDRRGSIVIVLGISMVMLLGFAALAVDIGYVMVARNELQNVSDAAALAATRRLGAIYETLSYQEQQSYICNPEELLSTAQEVGTKNQAAGKSISVNPDDVVIGTWDSKTKVLTPTLNQPDAVRVTARRDNAANGPVTTFFAKILGKDSVNVSAKGTAALTGESIAGPGGLPLPIGISKRWFQDPAFCNSSIRMYPTCPKEPCDALGCAGWHVYTGSPASAHTLRDILIGLKNGSFTSPEAIAGETHFNFIGGTVASDFDDFKALFDAMRVLNDQKFDHDDNPNTWTTVVVVYDWPDCTNPQGGITIYGFTTVVIETVLTSPEKTILGRVLCDNVESGRGGGNDLGTKGSIPNLVQ